MTLGEKLQKLRKSKGMSQEQLSAQITVSRQAISKWELGESIPDTENIIQLSKIFSVSTDYLLHDDIDNDLNVFAEKTISEDECSNKYYVISKWYIVGTIAFGILLLFILVFSIMGNIENYGVIISATLLFKGVPLLLIIIFFGSMAILYYKKAQNMSKK